MENILDRFLRYVRIDTQSNEHSSSYPSTPKQLDLCRMLVSECQAIGLQNVSLSEFGVVMATIPSNVDRDVPTIAWLAHVDTSPEFSGTFVNPIVHSNYDGQDIVLPGDSSRVIRVAENRALKGLVGATIITTDGTTLLGADDKAGIADTTSTLIQTDSTVSLLCFTTIQWRKRTADRREVVTDEQSEPVPQLSGIRLGLGSTDNPSMDQFATSLRLSPLLAIGIATRLHRFGGDLMPRKSMASLFLRQFQ